MMGSVIPEFLQESVARQRGKLSDWPNFDTRFSGDGVAKISRDIVDRPAPETPLPHRKTYGTIKNIGRPPAHSRPGTKPKGFSKTCAHEQKNPCTSYFGKDRAQCAACGKVFWASE